MNASLGRSIVKGLRDALIVGAGAGLSALVSEEALKALVSAGPVGGGLALIFGAGVRALQDYAKRRLAL